MQPHQVERGQVAVLAHLRQPGTPSPRHQRHTRRRRPRAGSLKGSERRPRRAIPTSRAAHKVDSPRRPAFASQRSAPPSQPPAGRGPLSAGPMAAPPRESMSTPPPVREAIKSNRTCVPVAPRDTWPMWRRSGDKGTLVPLQAKFPWASPSVFSSYTPGIVRVRDTYGCEIAL